MIDHPTRDSSVALALLLFGGPALFLLTQAWYLRLVVGTAPRSHLFAVAALAAVAAAGLPAPALATGVAVVVVLAALVAVEHLGGGDQPHADRSTAGT